MLRSSFCVIFLQKIGWIVGAVSPLFFIQVAAAVSLNLTVYDDGLSCPFDCDAHVVMHKSMNGTKFAHNPDSIAPKYKKCDINKECEICFDRGGSECLTTMYRGEGPGKKTFDLTPKFYEEWCKKEDIPVRLGAKCTELKQTASKLDGRVNCINNDTHPKCRELMRHALKEKQADMPLYSQCLSSGLVEYNKKLPSNKKRYNNCAYEFESNGGPNSNGLKWHKLLPGACRSGAFVGRDGLDCCSGNKIVDASLGIECRIFYPLETNAF